MWNCLSEVIISLLVTVSNGTIEAITLKRSVQGAYSNLRELPSVTLREGLLPGRYCPYPTRGCPDTGWALICSSMLACTLDEHA